MVYTKIDRSVLKNRNTSSINVQQSAVAVVCIFVVRVPSRTRDDL